MPTLTPTELKTFIPFVHGLCGIQLDETKGYLLESRLTPLLQEFQCHSFGELHAKAKGDASRKICGKIIDAISTHETSFFRDSSPFDLLKFKLVPEHFDHQRALGRRDPLPLHIWSAACSSGQEIYSIAITLKELLGDLSKYRIQLLGTDISDAAVAQASYGRYNKIEIERGLPPDKVQRYFVADGQGWRIKDELRALVTFRTLNLLEPYRGLGPFDFIFCRNVAIYFSPADRERLFERLVALLNPQGALIIGSTETLMGFNQRLVRKQYHQAVFYQSC